MPEQKSVGFPEGQGQSLKSRITEIVNTGKKRLFGRSFSRTSNVAISQDGVVEQDHLTEQTIEGVLESIDPQVPDVFRNQAREAARYIQLLDQGLEGNDRISRFRDQLKFSGFILQAIRWGHGKALPAWLQMDLRTKPADTQREERIGRAFAAWVDEEDFRLDIGRYGNYYILDDSPLTVPQPRQFKCYVKGDLETVIQNRKLADAFKDLRRTNLNPNKMKLFERSRLVLYYFKDVGLSDNIRAAFRTHGLDIRGPAQDVFQIEPTLDGQIKLDFYTSNDGALGDGRHSPIEYKLTDYNQAKFLDNYLQLCIWAGKDPSEPYKTSFVYFEDMDGLIKDKRKVNSLLPQAEKMAGYPVVYTRHKLDIAKK